MLDLILIINSSIAGFALAIASAKLVGADSDPKSPNTVLISVPVLSFLSKFCTVLSAKGWKYADCSLAISGESCLMLKALLSFASWDPKTLYESKYAPIPFFSRILDLSAASVVPDNPSIRLNQKTLGTSTSILAFSKALAIPMLSSLSMFSNILMFLISLLKSSNDLLILSILRSILEEAKVLSNALAALAEAFIAAPTPNSAVPTAAAPNVIGFINKGKTVAAILPIEPIIPGEPALAANAETFPTTWPPKVAALPTADVASFNAAEVILPLLLLVVSVNILDKTPPNSAIFTPAWVRLLANASALALILTKLSAATTSAILAIFSRSCTATPVASFKSPRTLSNWLPLSVAWSNISLIANA